MIPLDDITHSKPRLSIDTAGLGFTACSTPLTAVCVCEQLYYVAWQPNFDKKISSNKRGDGVKGVEQWTWMAVHCSTSQQNTKTVVFTDTGGT